MNYRITPVRMTVRPRLWRIGAAKEFVRRVAPIARIFLQNGIVAFVRPFIQIQRKENWKKRY